MPHSGELPVISLEDIIKAIGNMVPKNNIVPSEPSWGTGHFTASTANWPDVNRTAESTAAPYTWDLSGAGLCPVGARAVLIMSLIGVDSAAEILSFVASIWDFDYGAYNLHESLRRGLYTETTYKPATAAAQAVRAWMFKPVKIGPSRKLYVGLGNTAGGRFIQANYCGYLM